MCLALAIGSHHSSLRSHLCYRQIELVICNLTVQVLWILYVAFCQFPLFQNCTLLDRRGDLQILRCMVSSVEWSDLCLVWSYIGPERQSYTLGISTFLGQFFLTNINAFLAFVDISRWLQSNSLSLTVLTCLCPFICLSCELVSI